MSLHGYKPIELAIDPNHELNILAPSKIVLQYPRLCHHEVRTVIGLIQANVNIYIFPKYFYYLTFQDFYTQTSCEADDRR